MIDGLSAAPAIFRPSRFWEQLNATNLAQLSGDGFADFKRTVNNNYFQFLPVGPRDPQFRAMLASWLRHPTPAVLGARLADPRPHADTGGADPLRRWLGRAGYALFVSMLWEFARLRAGGRFPSLSEPALGRPLAVRHRGRQISQDLCNSALEHASIVEALPGRSLSGALMVELGSGYGRLAWYLLRVEPDVRIVLVDIPPALWVAQRYLTSLFADLPAFTFRRFTAQQAPAARDAVLASRISFLTPDQLAMLEPLEPTVFVNISSLHEMRPEQIAEYFREVERQRPDYFFTKQWRRWANPDDDLVLGQDDYPVRPGWGRLFERVHPVQTHFFEALYAVR